MIVLLIIGILLSACSADNLTLEPVAADPAFSEIEKNADTKFQKISPETAYAMMAQMMDYILLDVRSESEYVEKHIVGAMLIPVDIIERSAEAELPDKGTPIFVYCRSGIRSEKASSILAQLGYSAVYDIGGIISWPYATVSGMEDIDSAASDTQLHQGSSTLITDDPLLVEIWNGDIWKALYTCSAQLSHTMPIWTFDLYGGEVTDGGFDSILLVVRDEMDKVVDFTVSATEAGARDDPNIVLADVNFDGYLDILYSEGAIGAHGNYWYNLRIWSTEDRSFWYAEDFYEICNPVVDARDRIIRSFASNSAFEDEYSIYEFLNGMFFLRMELLMTYGDADGRDHRMFEIYHYYNGIRTLTKKGDFFFPPDGNDTGVADLYGSDSIWKLDDPIWLNSRHYQANA